MPDTCPRCGSDDIRHEHRPLAGLIDVICGHCRHGIREIDIRQVAERSRQVREELVLSVSVVSVP